MKFHKQRFLKKCYKGFAKRGLLRKPENPKSDVTVTSKDRFLLRFLTVIIKRMSYSIGDRYWIPDEDHAWSIGMVKEFKNSVLEFSTGDKGVIKKFRINDLKHKLEPCGSHIDDHVENLVDLDELSEGAILHHVRNRFAKKIIYTHVGSILVAVNPFENLPIYGERDIRRAYELNSIYPHVFVSASVAYQQLKANRKNQSILISGESGGILSSSPSHCI
jgi:myosin heavy subunit